MMNKIFGRSRVWGVAGLVVLGVWGTSNAASPARNATRYAAMQTQVEATMANRNAQCFANCVRIYRTQSGLKVVALDPHGDIFSIKRFPLAPGTMLVGIGPRTRSTSAPVAMPYSKPPSGAQANTSTGYSTTDTNSYPVIRNGTRYMIVVTTTFVYVNGQLIDVIVNRTEILLGPVKVLSPK